MTWADVADQYAVDVWPDNWRAALFFEAIGPGCWNVGPGGVVGLRYEALRELRLAQGVTASEWRELFPDLCVMEGAALAQMRKT